MWNYIPENNSESEKGIYVILHSYHASLVHFKTGEKAFLFFP